MIDAVLKKLRSFLTEGNRDAAPGTPRTAGYQASEAGIGFYNYGKRPPFTLMAADQMVLDQQVWFGTCVGNAPLASAEVEVTGPPEVVKFVGDVWDRIWSSCFSAIVRTKIYGHMGYEVMWRQCDAGVEPYELIDRHPWDVLPLVNRGRLVGISVNGVHANMGGHVRTTTGGKVYLTRGKGCWLNYRPRYGSRFGHALYEQAYAPWWDKASDGGALDLRRLRMLKDAWIGDQIKYATEDIIQRPDGTQITGRDIAREIGDNRLSGGAIYLPSDVYPDSGKAKYEYVPPTGVQGQSLIKEWIDDLDFDIFDGLLVPKEVIEAAAAGSGFSGRTFPFLAFLQLRDEEFAGYVRMLKSQPLDLAVAINFGMAAMKEYDIRPKPLIETIGKQMGDMGKPNTTDGGEGGGEQPDGGQYDGRRPAPRESGEQPQQFSIGEDPPKEKLAAKVIEPSAILVGDIRRRLDTLLKKKS